jgi:hypothetical protein
LRGTGRRQAARQQAKGGQDAKGEHFEFHFFIFLFILIWIHSSE